MQLDSLIPRDSTILYVVVASILAWLGGWFTRRKREPVELAKLHAEAQKTHAETRRIDADTDLSLIQTAAQAVAKAERVQARSDFWKWKAEDLQRQVDLLTLEANNADQQMRKQMNFIEVIGKKDEYLKLDQPKG